ncbi:MAG TPA: hypothetical protein VFI63_01100 [Solirubrobacterales bacterium]|nr:hypothetical protein [Solirubrobacterales bacterium]
MDSEDYVAFTDELVRSLARDPAVVGVVALGSLARRDYLPDRWSDHDFFVVVESGQQERLRTDLSWLPRAGAIAYSFRETAHGLKVLYRDGHLLELAVFDADELWLARVNRYRVLLDRGGVEARLAEVAAATAERLRAEAPSDGYLAGQLASAILVGAGLARRGEVLSGDLKIREAVGHLVTLLVRHVPAENAALLDSLDPLRRFERVHPRLGAELDVLLRHEPPAAAQGLLDLAERELGTRVPGLAAACDAVRRALG